MTKPSDLDRNQISALIYATTMPVALLMESPPQNTSNQIDTSISAHYKQEPNHDTKIHNEPLISPDCFTRGLFVLNILSENNDVNKI